MKHRASFPHRMNAPDRHNRQRDKRTNGRAFLSVCLLDGVLQKRELECTAPPRRRVQTARLVRRQRTDRMLLCAIGWCVSICDTCRKIVVVSDRCCWALPGRDGWPRGSVDDVVARHRRILHALNRPRPPRRAAPRRRGN